jgi:hypothetical protein
MYGKSYHLRYTSALRLPVFLREALRSISGGACSGLNSYHHTAHAFQKRTRLCEKLWS